MSVTMSAYASHQFAEHIAICSNAGYDELLAELRPLLPADDQQVLDESVMYHNLDLSVLDDEVALRIAGAFVQVLTRLRSTPRWSGEIGAHILEVMSRRVEGRVPPLVPPGSTDDLWQLYESAVAQHDPARCRAGLRTLIERAAERPPVEEEGRRVLALAWCALARAGEDCLAEAERQTAALVHPRSRGYGHLDLLSTALHVADRALAGRTLQTLIREGWEQPGLIGRLPEPAEFPEVSGGAQAVLEVFGAWLGPDGRLDPVLLAPVTVRPDPAVRDRLQRLLADGDDAALRAAAPEFADQVPRHRMAEP